MSAFLQAIAKYSPDQPRHPAGSSEGGRWADSVGVPAAYDADADMQDKWDSYLQGLPRTEKPAELSESDMPEELAAALQDLDDHNREQSAPRQGPQTITIETWEYKRPNVRGSAQLPVIFNPTQQELKRWAGREIDTVRFLNTPQGVVFWDALEALHQQVAHAIRDSFKEPVSGEFALRELGSTRHDYLFPKLSKSASFMRRVMSLLKFDPSQPRHPKGTPEGGQWAGDTRGPSIPSIEDFSDESMAPGQPMPAKFYAFRLAFDPETRDREPWLYAGKLRGVLSHWASMDEKNLPAGDYLTLYEITPGPDAVWGEYRARMNQYVHLSLPADSKAGYWQGGVSVPPMVPRRLVSSVPINEVATLGDWWDGKLTITREELMARLLDGQSRALLKFDETKVNRGKTTPESNEGSFAPKGTSTGGQSTPDPTGTPEFKAWFGNSKVVDAEGKPLVVYHGTKGNFTEFDIGSGRSGGSIGGATGAMFTADLEYAGNYGREERGGRVIAAHLRIENPLDGRDEAHRAEYFAGRNDGESLVDYAKRTGHDGAITSLDEFVVFRPEQIKSVSNARPTDDPHLLKFDESKVNRHPAGTPVDETTGVGGGRFAPKITTPRGIDDIKDDLYAIADELNNARSNSIHQANDGSLAKRFQGLRDELKAARASANLETSRQHIADTSEVPGPISADLDALLLLTAQDEAEETVAREMTAILSPAVIATSVGEAMPYKGGVATQYGIPAGDSEQYRMANAYGDERLEKDNRAWSEALDQYIGPEYDSLNDFGRLGNGSHYQVQAAHLQDRVPTLMAVYMSPSDHTGTYAEYLREISMQDREVIEHGAAFTEATQSFNARLEQVKLEAFEDRTMTAPVRNQRFVELVGQDSELVRLSQLQLDAETRVTAKRVAIEDSLRAIGAQNDPGFRAFAEGKARAIALLTAPPKTTASAYHNIMDLIWSRPPTTQPLVTYRGVKSGESINWDKLKPGDTFNLGGFTSTSSMLAAAKRFGRRMMYVYVPEGSRGVLTTTNDKEGEILINHGTQMQVLHQTNSKLFLKYIGGQS